MTSGLLRVIPASEAAQARRSARLDFCSRFASVMGYPLSEADAERWWPE